MKIDLTIGYDDLSKECKEQLKNLKVLGFDVQLHYPTLGRTNGISEWVALNNSYDATISPGSGLSISSK